MNYTLIYDDWKVILNRKKEGITFSFINTKNENELFSIDECIQDINIIYSFLQYDFQFKKHEFTINNKTYCMNNINNKSIIVLDPKKHKIESNVNYEEKILNVSSIAFFPVSNKIILSQDKEENQNLIYFYLFDYVNDNLNVKK